MKEAVVRIKSVEIKNFKNVVGGQITFDNSKKGFDASILGLYGQNGSGKTALIDSLSLLRIALSGQSVPAHYADFINVDSACATLIYTFNVSIKSERSSYFVRYEFSLRKDVVNSGTRDEHLNPASGFNKATIFGEVLSYSYESGNEKVKLMPVVDTRTKKVFIPATKYEILVGKSKETSTNLMVAKKYTETTSRSFVFSGELYNTISKNCKETYHLYLFESLIYYGHFELFVINSSISGLINMSALPIAFDFENGHRPTMGNLMISLNEPSLIPEGAAELIEKVIENMNVVLKQIVPGLTVGVKNLGTQIDSMGNIERRIQLVSNKNNKEIPLQYESEGIKKIVSILQLLIVVYNMPSVTVAVDELDSGIFEYLLGELLRIISEKGKGQLIFTSHNLRALETLDKGFVAFTTTNPQNRYIRMSNVKTSNNLRDFYYRDIILGEQEESVYDSTNNYEIALAFREAGDTNVS